MRDEPKNEETAYDGDDNRTTNIAKPKQSTELIVVDGGGEDYNLMGPNARRAHICCGCDTRNAVFVVDSISICFYVFATVSFSLLFGDTFNYDDDHVQSVMEALDDAKIGFTISVFVIGIISSVIGICGAKFFNKVAIAVGGIWFAFETIRSLCLLDIAGAVLAAGFCYPHAVFYYEMKNGIMSPENYPNEKVCCDCCCGC